MKKRGLLLLVISIGCVVLSYLMTLLLNDNQIIYSAKEDGLFETGSSLAFLLVSILFLFLFFKDNQGNDFYFVTLKKNLFFLLLSLLFFFAFGEEISWGQRIFNFGTPDALKNVNVQDEFNLHNLTLFDGLGQDGKFKSGLARLFTAAGLFSVFWFSYCLVLPIVNKLTIVSNHVKTINIPVPPIWIGLLFLFNFLIFEAQEAGLSGEMLRAVCEIKEFNFSFLFLMLGVWFSINDKTGKSKEEN